MVVLDGTGKGTIKCSNNDNGDNSSSSSSSSAAQITFKASGYPRGTSADIIGGGTVRLYSIDIGTTRGANVTMEGSTGSGSIYSEGFTLQIDRAVVKYLFSAEDASLTSSASAPVNLDIISACISKSAILDFDSSLIPPLDFNLRT